MCDIRSEWSKCNFAFEFLFEHLTGKIDDFDELVTLIERLDESGGLVLSNMLTFNISIVTFARKIHIDGKQN